MKFKLWTTLAFAGLLLTLIAAQSLGRWPIKAASADTPTPATDTPTPPPSTNTPLPPSATPIPASVTPSPTATPIFVNVTSPFINFPQAACVGSPFSSFFSANVTFTWLPANGATLQFLDLSLFDNDFQDGTYLSTPLPITQSSFTWNGLLVGQAHFWRVTSLTPAGWVSSNFGYFSPCGNPVLLPMSFVCTGFGRASVTFRWAPSSPAGIFTFVDLTLFNNNFAPGTFIGGGPFPGTNQALVWPGILANMTHYVRVNTFNGSFWSPSQTGTFFAAC